MYLIIILLCILAFFVGFLMGSFEKNIFISPTEKLKRAEIQKLRREYENFLNYDGSEQP